MMSRETTEKEEYRAMGLAAAGIHSHSMQAADDDGILTHATALFKALEAPIADVNKLIKCELLIWLGGDAYAVGDFLVANRNMRATGYYTPSAHIGRSKLYVTANYRYTLDPSLGRPLSGLSRDDLRHYTCPGVSSTGEIREALDPTETDEGEKKEAKKPELTTKPLTPELKDLDLTLNSELSKEKSKEKRKEEPELTPADAHDAVSNGDEIVSKGMETQDSPDFTAFWEAYPKKVGKGACRKWWKVHKPGHELVTQMLEVIASISQTEQWTKNKGQFIPLPHTWLNQTRWEDGDPVPGGSGSSSLSSAGAGAGFAAFWDGLDEYQKESAIKTAEEAGFKTVKEWYDAH